MRSEVSIKMEYIQNLFLGVQAYMKNEPELEELIVYLDSVPPEFRSVAYESASMALSLLDMSRENEWDEWKKLYFHSGKVHSFHLDIGLGLAFAKTETIPDSNWESLHPLMRWMVFDGMGYYYGLFRGRRTVKNQIVPEGIEWQDMKGFDQGIGRRLWYISMGDVRKVTELIQTFPSARHADLWRGVGIACGYVGGSKQADLEHLLEAASVRKKQLCAGIALAAISRSASNSETDDLKTACRVLCKKTLDEIAGEKNKIVAQLDPDAGHSYDHWIFQLESEFA